MRRTTLIQGFCDITAPVWNMFTEADKDGLWSHVRNRLVDYHYPFPDGSELLPDRTRYHAHPMRFIPDLKEDRPANSARAPENSLGAIECPAELATFFRLVITMPLRLAERPEDRTGE
jgi:hypothetical protein